MMEDVNYLLYMVKFGLVNRISTFVGYLMPNISVSVSLFNGISTLFRLFNAKAILLEEQ